MIAAAAVESLFSNQTGEEKLQAAVNLVNSGVVGFAIAQPNSSAAGNVQQITSSVPELVSSAVGLLNLFGVFKHKAK
jgi:hypothetical protein